MVTERGAGLLIGAAFTWLLGRFLGVPELYVVAGAGCALAGLSVASVWLGSARLDAGRTVSPARIAWGGRTVVRVALRNTGRLPSGLLLVSDEIPYALADAPRFSVPGLARRAQVDLGYELHGAGRGRYDVGPARVRLRDPFGLAERVRRVGATAELVVYPRVERLGGGVPAAGRQGDGGAHRRTLLHAGDDFSTIREWAPGDDVRLVHWPSSAHRDRLMVRQFEQPYEPLATLVCDTRALVHRGAGPASTLETAVTAVASVAGHLAAHGHRLRLALPEDRETPPIQPLERLMDRLAMVEASRETSLAPALGGLAGRASGGLLVAALAPPADGGERLGAHPDIRALLAAGRPYSVRIALVVDTGALAGPRGGQERPAALLAAALHGAGWRTALLRPGAPMSDAWNRVAGPTAMVLGGAR
ncbi:MAG TPA: DUF58 domain-containing protein [Egibacteraceae bacterium]|nr:DUF58 domain-containing protein [Egibacteraceae bacterium]